MSEQTKKGLVPELRFPEFKNDAEWGKKVLNNKDIATFVKDREPLDQLNLNSYVSTENLLADYSGVAKASKLPPSGSFTSYKPNDVLISNIRPYLKKVWFADKVGAASNDVIVIRPSAKISATYLLHVLKNDEFINFVMKGAKGVKMPRGDIASIQAYPIALPKSNEQQKIADCLSSLDELVSAHTQKLDVLKAHKKGLMQQLFPAEGETVPKLRFPEFLGTDDWNKGCIDDLANLVMGNAFKSADFVDKGIQLIRMGNLYQGNLQLSRTPVYLPSSFEKEYSKFVIKPLDLLMSMTGTVGKEDYGYVVQVPENSSLFMLNQRVVKVIPKKKCIKEFILQLLKSDNFLTYLYSLPGGTKQANLSAAQLKGLVVMFPTRKEQQKIADCLSKLDELITAQNQKTEALKAHKKGLMQRLFPTINEVNA
jgi:type I restriction enzyme S subunit